MQISVFRPKVDSMTVLRSSRAVRPPYARAPPLEGEDRRTLCLLPRSRSKYSKVCQGCTVPVVYSPPQSADSMSTFKRDPR